MTTYLRRRLNFSVLAVLLMETPPLIKHTPYSSKISSRRPGTRHPALAIQAVYTNLTAMAYYESLFSEYSTTDVELIFMLHSEIPQRHTSLVFVLIGLFVHLALFALTAVAFLCLTRYSLLGDIWYTIAQMSKLKVVKQLDSPRASVATDKEVEKQWKRNGTASLPVSLRPASRSSDCEDEDESVVAVVFT